MAGHLCGRVLMQALTCGYYLFYMSVLLGCWAVWFLPPRAAASASADRRTSVEWRQTVLPIGIAWIAGVLPLVPVLWRTDSGRRDPIATRIQQSLTFSSLSDMPAVSSEESLR